ncbi:MAG: hypothetical protein DCC55_01305 [Chloroflexi bacterium]|nr:MAG: hypothetical protein DCC55_01305 [Chloroflexota bacterium]
MGLLPSGRLPNTGLWTKDVSAIQHASVLPAAALRAALRSFPLIRRYPLLLAGITLLGFGLRLPLLDRFPLREDEAIYSFWALHFWRVDPFFLSVWPDKPPLYLWFQAGALELFGSNQAGARVLNIVASTLTIVVVAAIGRHFWRRRGAVSAALSLSLNPFTIGFAPTAFTDPMLVLAGSLALLAALRGRSFWAGLWLGVAIMTKQQGVLYIPLISALLVNEVRGPVQLGLRNVRTFFAGLSLVVAPILYWDSLRWGVAPSPWDLGVRNYGALAITPVAEWPERLAAWAPLVWHLTASWPVWGVLLCGLGGVLIHTKQLRVHDQVTSSASQKVPISLGILAAWSLGFLVLHAVTTVQPWDRYLLPLAPVVALGVAGAVARYASRLASGYGALLFVLLLLLLAPPAIQAANGELPIGGDHGAYDGLTSALAWLRQTAPDDVVLYHRTMGWHYRFYLYDEVETGRYELRWFPSAIYLADNAAKTPHRRNLWVEPVWAHQTNLAHHLAVRSLHVHERQRFGAFVVFEIEQLGRAHCAWCVCRPDPPGLVILETDGSAPLCQRD